MSQYRAWGKRGLDIVAATAGLVVLSPVLLVVAVLVRAKLGSPVIYKQKPPGLNGEIFTLYKFRSMLDTTGADGQPLSNADRLTPFGKALRSTSLDELPELWNILRGEMSFVGPRPLLVEYLELYSDEEKKRHSVRPGLTGLAQVNGRNALSWKDKFALDVDYVKDVSATSDLRILVSTLKTVVRRSGVSADGEVAGRRFRGHADGSN